MKLKKGSQAAKNYMAKIRAKRGKVGAAPKKAAPKKAAKAIKTELKAKGLKMPHGYGVEKRARIGTNNEIVLSAYKETAARLKTYEGYLLHVSSMIKNKKALNLNADTLKRYELSKKNFQTLIKEFKTHLRELKKLL
jgi:hypothetical protein